METHQKNKLVIVEGLTGSGKSTMAHFVARQHHKNDIPARWIHEGELSHPVFVDDVEDDLEQFKTEMLQKWQTFVRSIGTSNEVVIIEASFFNNLMDTLFMHNVETDAIIAYYEQLQIIIAPLNPILIYLTQDDVPKALRKNYANRGEGFVQFVIDLCDNTPYAQKHNLTGYEGTFTFWQDFVTLTDTLFAHSRFGKLRIENSAGDWERYNQEVTAFLGLSHVPEYTLSEKDADRYVGVYVDGEHNRRFRVSYENGALGINLMAQTKLVPQGEHHFAAESWHFVIQFEDERLKIGGQDIDYLELVGTVAIKES